MTPGSRQDEEQLAALLRELREPPAAWVEAAKQLPEARRQLDGIVERAETDAAYRQKVLDGLEAALREAGHEPRPNLVAALRSRLAPADEEPG